MYFFLASFLAEMVLPAGKYPAGNASTAPRHDTEPVRKFYIWHPFVVVVIVIPAQPARVPVSSLYPLSRPGAPPASFRLFSFCALLLAPSRRRSCSPAIILGEFFFHLVTTSWLWGMIATPTHAVPIWCQTPLSLTLSQNK